MKTLPEEAFDVYLGEKARRERGGPAIAFGTCCANAMGADIAIHGCPPYPFALGERLDEPLISFHEPDTHVHGEGDLAGHGAAAAVAGHASDHALSFIGRRPLLMICYSPEPVVAF